MTNRPTYLYFGGSIVPYSDARVHILSTAFKYSATVYEGVRAYWSDELDQLFVFRLDDHLDRLAGSAKIARIPLPMPTADIQTALLELIRKNDLREDLHIRVLVYVSEDDGQMASVDPVEVAIAAMPMGRFPEVGKGSEALNVCISHWVRISDMSMPPRVKSTANYMNSRLALMQARHGGYDDAILVDAFGKVTEGPGYNLFMVRNQSVSTPPLTQSVLEGITRDTLLRLFRDLHDVDVDERTIDKTELYLANEVFFCGSGKEVKAIRSVDGLTIGEGGEGPITNAIRESYFSVVRGGLPDYSHWLTAVYE